MDLEQQLADVNGRFNIDLIAAYIGNDPHKFAQLFNIIKNAQYPIRERAGWAMTACCDLHPELALNYIDSMIEMAHTLQNQSVLRSIMYVLAATTLSEIHEGLLYDKCVEMLFSKNDIAVRAYAMQVLYNISVKEPELRHELILLFEDLLKKGDSKGMTTKATKLLTLLRKNK